MQVISNNYGLTAIFFNTGLYTGFDFAQSIVAAMAPRARYDYIFVVSKFNFHLNRDRYLKVGTIVNGLLA